MQKEVKFIGLVREASVIIKHIMETLLTFGLMGGPNGFRGVLVLCYQSVLPVCYQRVQDSYLTHCVI